MDKAKSESIIEVVVPVLLTIAISTALVYLSHGWSLTSIFVPALVIALFVYLRTKERILKNTQSILPIYLIALGVQFLHFAEEYVTQFYSRWPVEIFGAEPYSANLFVFVNMFGYMIFILGAVALLQNVKLGGFIIWFFAVMGVIGNAILHPIYAIMVGGYFPGLLTSLLNFIIGPILVGKMVKPR